ncbi:hypothetical protein SAMN05444714_0703 [Yoonia litorea]|uniref:Uncharacterized protein n=1 Tax=Yoonia litorea TaxID=1123755 RepID=A0A1I6LMJ1_9RHOB|nr:hypothetical protein SAMN05444714_0703 [Yoonia litorea]
MNKCECRDKPGIFYFGSLLSSIVVTLPYSFAPEWSDKR